MAGFFARLRDAVFGKRADRGRAPDAVTLDPERAERGLVLSEIDSDDHTTQVLMDELGIKSRPDEKEQKAA